MGSSKTASLYLMIFDLLSGKGRNQFSTLNAFTADSEYVGLGYVSSISSNEVNLNFSYHAIRFLT
jgi:hypothetical protein